MKQFGLIVSEPAQDAALRASLVELLNQQDIPFTGFTEAPAPLFANLGRMRNAFLYRAAYALMVPSQPLPAALLKAHLSSDALPGNVIRKYVRLQLSLLPYFRPGREITPCEGGVSIGENLRILCLADDGTIDVPLPGELWTDISDQCIIIGRCRLMRGYNQLPILVRRNTLLPVGENDQTTDADDADRLTLHWFHPDGAAECTLADGTYYRVTQIGGRIQYETNATKDWHLLVHAIGGEQFVR